MIRVSSVPVQVYQACSTYVLDTGNEVYVNDMLIGPDARAYIHTITRVNGKIVMTPLYLTADVHPTVMKRCFDDIAKVDAHMAIISKELRNE